MVIPAHLNIGNCVIPAAAFGIGELPPAELTKSAAAITALIAHAQGAIAKRFGTKEAVAKAFFGKGRAGSPCNVGDTPGSQDQGGGRRRRSQRRRRSRRRRRQRGGDGEQHEIVAHALTTFLIGAALGLGVYGGWWALSATLGHFFPICGHGFWQQAGGAAIGRWLGRMTGSAGTNPCVYNQQVWSAVITGLIGIIAAWWAAEGVAKASGGKIYGPRARLSDLYNRVYAYILRTLNARRAPNMEEFENELGGGPGGPGGGPGDGGGGGGGGDGGLGGDMAAANILLGLSATPQGGGRRRRSRRRSRRRRRSRHRSRRRRRRTNRRKRRSRRRRR